MTPAGEAFLRSAIVIGRRARSTEARALADLCERALQAEGLELEGSPAPELSAAAARMRRLRAERSANGAEQPPPQDANRVANSGANVRANAGGLGGSLSSESKDLQDLERERAANSGANVRANSGANVRANSGERYLRLGDRLTEELRAIAEMATVQDIEGAWVKFCGHHADKWVHVAGRWQVWCVNESRRERTERDRRADKPPVDANGETAAQRWARIDREVTERAEADRRAHQADDDQAQRARLAATRPAGGPTRIGGTHG